MSEKEKDRYPEWSVGALKPQSIDNISESQLSTLAKDIAMGKVFTSDHVPPNQMQNLLSMIFMPIALGALSDLSDAAKKDIGFIYEYLDKAGPRSINGFPIFFSCAYVNIHDRKLIWEKVSQIEKMLESI